MKTPGLVTPTNKQPNSPFALFCRTSVTFLYFTFTYTNLMALELWQYNNNNIIITCGVERTDSPYIISLFFFFFILTWFFFAHINQQNCFNVFNIFFFVAYTQERQQCKMSRITMKEIVMQQPISNWASQYYNIDVD